MGDTGPMHLLVADSTGSVMVYRGMQLMWASKFEVPPVALDIAHFGNVGRVVTPGCQIGYMDGPILAVMSWCFDCKITR